MRKIFLIFFVIIACLGCQDSKEHEIDEAIFEFENIVRAPEATKKHAINDVIKIYFSEWTFDDPYEPIAIDIKNNEIYVNPSINIREFRADDSFQISDANKILEILEKYDVQSWEKDYTFEDPDTYQDGYSWSLWLQFEDGTVEKHSGEGTDVEKLTPKNFREFARELTKFVEVELEEN